jgi:hypothetical protein
MTSFDKIMPDKELLLKDLCSRLNTKLVCSIYRTDDQGIGYRDEILHGYCKGDIWYEFYFSEDCCICIDNVSKIKPYLFPLSSMTGEHRKELFRLSGIDIINGKFYANNEFTLEETLSGINWLLKNHFDINELIPMGLANDATNLNIY